MENSTSEDGLGLFQQLRIHELEETDRRNRQTSVERDADVTCLLHQFYAKERCKVLKEQEELPQQNFDSRLVQVNNGHMINSPQSENQPSVYELGRQTVIDKVLIVPGRGDVAVVGDYVNTTTVPPHATEGGSFDDVHSHIENQQFVPLESVNADPQLLSAVANAREQYADALSQGKIVRISGIMMGCRSWVEEQLNPESIPG